ncbi:MAG TPA: hypothetical protein ENN99_12700 [Chloroflexi bacterium]|nr:hypothetical protein [Chloroflexota bacterium]
MSELLYFNGINPTTGSYGLPPMTPEELSQKVWQDDLDAYQRMQALEEKLGRAAINAPKVLDIVTLLVEASVEMVRGRSIPPDEWFDELARRLSEIVLGEGEVQPGSVRELADRLRRDPVSTVKQIVERLSQGAGRELAELLLSGAPDNRAELKEKLKDATQRQIAALQKEQLDADVARALAQTPARRSDWLAAVTQALGQMEIEGLKALTEVRGVISEPLDVLIQALSGLESDAVAPLVGQLRALRSRGERTRWPGLVDTLHEHLLHLATEGEEDTLWEGVVGALHRWLGALRQKVSHLAPVEWVNPTRLEEAGWGVIFPAGMEAGRQAAIQERLAPLLALRQAQAGEYFRLYKGAEGYRAGESANGFLGRHGARASDPADPENVPYYLLLVGGPEGIPFEFQYQLDVQYAVGRIDFGADLEAYANYAHNVAAAEQEEAAPSSRVTFFGVRNRDDEATELSARYLISPLYEHLRAQGFETDWQLERVAPEEATKQRLLTVLQDDHPALLFVASHGLEFDVADPEQRARQEREQGALLCGDWPSSGDAERKVRPEHYLSGQDVRERGAAINLQGSILFLFACYGAGTPLYDEYYKQRFKRTGQAIAERPFIADLPKAMLSLSERGALAVVGHVERAWGTSFMGKKEGGPRASKAKLNPHVAVFDSALERLLKGHPVGSAMDYFDLRYAALATELVPLMEANTPDKYELAEKWTAHNDARGYVVIGDPAVRLRAAQVSE